VSTLVVGIMLPQADGPGSEAYYAEAVGERPISVRYVNESMGKCVFSDAAFAVGQTVWHERPFVAMQHLSSKATVKACHHTHCFVGSLEEHMDSVAGVELESELPVKQFVPYAVPKGITRLVRPPATGKSSSSGAPPDPDPVDDLVHYRDEHTEAMAMEEYQNIFAPSEHVDAFVQHACDTNEIFLLAAKVVAKILVRWIHCRDIEKAMEPATRFQSSPWWEVVVLEGVPEGEGTVEQYQDIFKVRVNHTHSPASRQGERESLTGATHLRSVRPPPPN
jgi:hypothetical protein